MEWATLALLHPGRLHCGLGHGVTEWMHQIGAQSSSPVTLLRDMSEVVRRLLRGQTVTHAGGTVKLDDVRLEYPPTVIPPVSLGVRGPVSLRLAGEVADGAILSEWSSAQYVKWARARIAEGRRLGGVSTSFRLTVFVGFCFADDSEALDATTAATRLVQDRPDMLRMMWPERAERDLVPSIDEVMATGLAVGSGADIASHLTSLAKAGADALVLVPMGEPVGQLGRALTEVIPLLPATGADS